MKFAFAVGAALVLLAQGSAFAASQDKYELSQPNLGWEKTYLKEFPDAQKVMDRMIEITVRQLKEPEQDILHNRICSALVYKMALDRKLAKADQRLAVVTDILHHIDKEETDAVLTNPKVFGEIAAMIADLKKSGHFKSSPRFWGDEAVLKNPKVGGFAAKDIDRVQAAIVGHSTGYWYFRQSIDAAAGRKAALETIYPEPEDDIALFAHDADLISQFAPESVVPEGSKWRVLAAKRWGAKSAVEEAHVVYYVFFRLFEEAKIPGASDDPPISDTDAEQRRLSVSATGRRPPCELRRRVVSYWIRFPVKRSRLCRTMDTTPPRNLASRREP